MSPRVLCCLLIGVTLVLLGSATFASASWLYTENWATASANELPSGLGAYAWTALPDYPGWKIDVYSPSTTGVALAVSNNVLTLTQPANLGGTSDVFVSAATILSAAGQSGTSFDLTKGPVTMTVPIYQDHSAWAYLAAGQIDVNNGSCLAISGVGTTFWNGNASGATVSGTIPFQLPPVTNDVWLNLSTTLSELSPTSYQIVWSFSSADGKTSYGSETVSQTTAPYLGGFSFAAQSGTVNNMALSLGAFSVQQVATPEPSNLVLLATGLFGLLAYAWRKGKCVPS